MWHIKAEIQTASVIYISYNVSLVVKASSKITNSVCLTTPVHDSNWCVSYYFYFCIQAQRPLEVTRAHVPASLISRVKFAARPEKPFFKPLPLATTRLASPWKRFAVTAPGFFSTVSTNSDDVTAISDPFPDPETTDVGLFVIRTAYNIRLHLSQTYNNLESELIKINY